MRRKNLLLLLLLVSPHLFAASVDTVQVYSQAMQKNYKCVVITPAKEKKSKPSFPVLYLLHGYGGWYSNWIIRVPELQQYADQFQMMIVCPDGGNNWYFDSPVDSALRFETYVGQEIPDYIDAHYPTIRDRKSRAITGLSMGGHGGLFLGLRHADRFGACGSMSGAVDITRLRNKFDLAKKIGDTASYANTWKEFSVFYRVDAYPKDSVAMIIDCGVDDFLIAENRALHEKLVRLKIPHDYTERPGKHEWPYWRNSIKYQLLFFRDFFNRNK